MDVEEGERRKYRRMDGWMALLDAGSLFCI
jgi:hypothetical protein